MHSSPSSITRVAWQGVPSSSIASVPHSPRHRAVVVGGHDRGGELVAEAARVHRRVLLHGVGLEPVAGGLVEQHAAEAVADHDRHPAGRRRARVEHRQRAARGLVGDGRGVAVEQLEAGVARRATPMPASTRSSRRATTCAPSRTRVRSSPASSPSELATCTSAPRLVVGGRRPALTSAPARARALVALAQQLGLALRRDRASGRSAIVLARRRLRARAQRRAAVVSTAARPTRPRRRAARGRARRARRRARSRSTSPATTRIDAPISEPALGALDAAVVERQREAGAALRRRGRRSRRRGAARARAGARRARRGSAWRLVRHRRAPPARARRSARARARAAGPPRASRRRAPAPRRARPARAPAGGAPRCGGASRRRPPRRSRPAGPLARRGFTPLPAASRARARASAAGRALEVAQHRVHVVEDQAGVHRAVRRRRPSRARPPPARTARPARAKHVDLDAARRRRAPARPSSPRDRCGRRPGEPVGRRAGPRTRAARPSRSSSSAPRMSVGQLEQVSEREVVRRSPPSAYNIARVADCDDGRFGTMRRSR